MAKALCALVREESGASDAEVQELLDMLQEGGTIPVREHQVHQESDDGGARRGLVGSGTSQKFVSRGVKHVETCVQGATSNDADKSQDTRDVTWDSFDVLRRIISQKASLAP